MSDEKRDRGPGRPENGRPADFPGGAKGDARGEGRDRRKFGRRRFGHGLRPGEGQGRGLEGQGDARGEAPAEQGLRPEPVACPLCGKPVYDLSTALCADREAPAPAHFDCVFERVAAAENLGPGEKIVYLGSGAFGVVEFKDKNESSFVVKRKIQWEKEGEKQDWRRSLSSRISNL